MTSRKAKTSLVGKTASKTHSSCRNGLTSPVCKKERHPFCICDNYKAIIVIICIELRAPSVKLQMSSSKLEGSNSEHEAVPFSASVNMHVWPLLQNKKVGYKTKVYKSKSCSINGSFILQGCGWAKILTSSFMFSSKMSLLQWSLFIANALKLDSPMVARLAVFN